MPEPVLSFQLPQELRQKSPLHNLNPSARSPPPILFLTQYLGSRPSLHYCAVWLWTVPPLLALSSPCWVTGRMGGITDLSIAAGCPTPGGAIPLSLPRTAPRRFPSPLQDQGRQERQEVHLPLLRAPVPNGSQVLAPTDAEPRHGRTGAADTRDAGPGAQGRAERINGWKVFDCSFCPFPA